MPPLSQKALDRLRELFKPGSVVPGEGGPNRRVLRIEEDKGGPYVVYRQLLGGSLVSGERRVKLVNFYNWARCHMDRGERLGDDRGMYRRA